MLSAKIQVFANQYKDSLLKDVIPFWERHSIDAEHGGYFTSLDRKGDVFDTDKFIWLQARQVWTFALLYNKVSRHQPWLEVARGGVEFLKRAGRAESGSFYFAVDQKGNPLTHPYNIYADCFASLAFYEYGLACDDEACLAIAMETYDRFVQRLNDPKGQYEKSTGHRKLDSFGLPMMTAYLTLQLSDNLAEADIEKVLDICIQKITVQHYDPALGVIREFVKPEGGFMDSYNGRLLNPGHAVEAMWFLMDIALRREDDRLFDWATKVCLQVLEYSWDEEFGGLYYFMDAKNAPPQQLEWDQKLWWPHLEALIALSKSFAHTQSPDVWKWFEKVHQFTWDKFPDPAYGEWYGYLDRRGNPLLHLKGGKWKGCYHVPRGLFECWQNLGSIV